MKYLTRLLQKKLRKYRLNKYLKLNKFHCFQYSVVPSDLVSFYISIRDDTSRIAEIQLPVSELEFDSERSSKVFLSHRKNKLVKFLSNIIALYDHLIFLIMKC